jgi:signal transduction histidine kinase/DNA-binding response OmpR family regulator
MRLTTQHRNLSKEIALRCNAAGKIVELDERAEARLPGLLGRTLSEVAACGTSVKVEALLTEASRGVSSPFDLSFETERGIVTLCFRGAPDDDGISLVGEVVGGDSAVALDGLSSAMSKIADLHREAERQRQELGRINQELAESNRGLVSLHAELDEGADALRRALEVKGRVVASVSHEFRTPLHSMLGIVRLLLDESDGPVNEEQRAQLGFVLESARTLQSLVDDLLDLARLEGGASALRPTTFRVSELLETLRGTMRPLATDPAVELRVEMPEHDLQLETDDGKISHILRNLVSNALKFTERGEVKLWVEAVGADRVRFVVRDTGIGIPEEHLGKVFEEFAQVESPIQRRVKGTGLGLTLARRLAASLGGTLTLESKVKEGSTFTLEIPIEHAEIVTMRDLVARSDQLDPGRSPVLVVEDDRQTMFLYERYLAASGFQVVPARTIDDARAAVKRVLPAAIVLDVMLEGESTWRFLEELRAEERTRDIPVMVVTVVDRTQKARALGANELWLKPVDPGKLARKLSELAVAGAVKVLVVDDDPAARYLIRKYLDGTPYMVVEAGNVADAVRLARVERPQLILLDFVLGENETAFDVLDELRSHPLTRAIPVILNTARDLSAEELARLTSETSAVLRKQSLSRELAITRIRDALVQGKERAVER